MAVNNRLNLGVPGITFEQMKAWAMANIEVIGHTHTFASITGKPTTIGGYGITDFNALGDARWSLLGHTHTFASLTAKPTTIGGYGITDFESSGDARWAPLLHFHTFASILSKPTTLSGYGITDASPLGHTHTFGSLTGKPTTVTGYGITDPIVMGPATATDNALARFDGTTGKLVQNSAASVGDTGIVRAAGLVLGAGIGTLGEVLDVVGDFIISGGMQSWEEGEVFGTQVSLTPTFNARWLRIGNGNNNAHFGVGDETPGSTFATSVANAAFISSTTDIELIRDGVRRLGVTNSGADVVGVLSADTLSSDTASVGGVIGDSSALEVVGGFSLSGLFKSYIDSGEVLGNETNVLSPGDDVYGRISNGFNSLYFGVGTDTPAGTGFLRGSVANAAVLHSSSADLEIIRANTKRIGVTSAGVEVFGTLLVNGSPVGTGSGDVIGPASATNEALVRFDGTTGKLVQNSTALLSDTGSLSVTHLNVHNGIGGVEAINVIGHVSVSGELQVWEGGEILGTLNSLTPSKNATYIRITNDGINQSYFGMGDETPGSSFATSVAHATFISSATDIELIRAGVKRLGVTSAGVAITGTLLVNGSPVGAGDVVGPASTNNNVLVRFDGGTGKLIKGGGPILDDSGNLVMTGALTLAGGLSGATTGAFSSNVTIGGTLNVTGIATFGGFRFANNVPLQWRNGANTADVNVISLNAADNVEINAPLAESILMRINSVNVAEVYGGGLNLTGALAVSGNLSLTGSGGKYVAFTRNDGVANVGGMGWHTDSIFYVAGHPSLSPTAGSTVRIYGFGGALKLGNNAVGDVLDVSAAGRVGIGLSTAPVKLAVLSGVSTNSISTPVLSLHSDRSDFYATINSYRGGDSTRLGLGFSTVDGGALTEWMRLYPNGDLQVNKLAGVGTRVVGVTSTGLLTITSLGSGDVVGPASATNNAIATFNGTGGKTIQNTGVTIASNIINAAGYKTSGSTGISTTVDTSLGTWELTFAGGLLISATQTS